MSSVTRRFNFCAAHRLQHHDGKCARLHGHNYTAVVTVRGTIDAVSGMVVDFGVMKEEIGEWIDAYWDHRVILQDTDPYGSALASVVNYEAHEINIMAAPPTAENLALFLARIVEEFGYNGVSVEMVETPNCSAGWAG